VRKKLVEREEEERRKSRKIKDINRVEEQEKELLLQIYACKMVDVKVDTEDIKNNKEKGTLGALHAIHPAPRHPSPRPPFAPPADVMSLLYYSVHHSTSSPKDLPHLRVKVRRLSIVVYRIVNQGDRCE